MRSSVVRRASLAAAAAAAASLLLLLLTTLVAAQDQLDDQLQPADATLDDSDPVIVVPSLSSKAAVVATAEARRVLFRPGLDSGLGDWQLSVSASFPTHSTALSPATNPFPLHVSLQALEAPRRFSFIATPALRPGAQLVGFDWARNGTTGTVGSGQAVQWADGLPSWLTFVAPAAGSSTFTLILTVPQSGDRTVVYASPSPVILLFRAVLQYQSAAPPQPDEGDTSDPSASSTAPTTTTGSTTAAPPLVLIEEVQSFAMLVSLSIMQPFTSRVTQMISSYALTQTPNLLDPRNRLANQRGAANGVAALRIDWRDEIVFQCSSTASTECNLCLAETTAATPSSTPFCAFPAGSFFNAASGILRVRNPISLLGSLQINAGATLEFNHASSTSATASSTPLIMSVSVIDSRDQLGNSIPIINEGQITVRKGHVVVYSTMLGAGAITVYPGGSIEFISLLPAPNVFYFNHTSLSTAAVSNSLGGMSANQTRPPRIPRRSLLQAIDFDTDATTSTTGPAVSSSTGPSNSSPTTVASSAASSSPPRSSTATTASLSSTGGAASSSTATVPSVASSSTAPAKTPVTPPPVTPFTPHPSSILVSFGGAVLFTHGTFVFHAPFQSSLYQAANSTTVAQDGGNRFVIRPSAHVIFDEPQIVPTTTVSTIRPDHVISCSQFHNLGQLSVWNGTLNFTSILFFKSFGLLNLTSTSRVHVDLSDNIVWNRVDGWNAYRGVPMTDDGRKDLQSVVALLTTSSSAVSTSSSTTDAASSASSSSSSLSSLMTAATGSLVSRASSGGVGLLIDGFFLFRSGKLGFSGGILARGLSHVFIKKGVEWRIEVEPSGDQAAADAASFLHFSGIELSLDGVLSLSRGYLTLLTPLLQIEGHGQLIARGADTRVRIDNHRVNRDIYTQMMSGATADPETAVVLVENPDSLVDPTADLYTMKNVTQQAVQTIPPFRECLIAPCLLTSGCQSFLVSGGASLTLAPLTFLHFLPRASATVESTQLEGGALILDSGVNFRGNSIVQNSSDPAAVVNGIATLAAAVYIGNDSQITMMDGEVPVAGTTSSSQFKPATCSFSFGNLTGSGVLDCSARVISLDSVLLYPTFTSSSPFTPIIYQPPPVTAATAASSSSSTSVTIVAAEAPVLQFSSDLRLSERTMTQLDIFGFHSIAAVRVLGSTALAGTLVLNASLHRWPFDLTVGSKSSRVQSKSPANATHIITASSSAVDTGVGLGETSPGTTAGDTPGSITSSSGSVTSSSSAPPGVDTAALLTSSLGLLPFNSSAHFNSVRLSSLYEILPLGWSLDIEYVSSRLSADGSGTILPANSTAPSVLVETTFLLKTYAPNYQPNTTTQAQSTSDARPQQAEHPAFGGCIAAAIAALLYARDWR